MRVLKVLFALASLIIASLALEADKQQPLSHDEDLKVPGENPLFYCDDPKNDTLSIDHADLVPDKIKPGANITIEIYGDLSHSIKNGSIVNFEVLLKAGPSTIPLVSNKESLCELLDEGCPLEKGEATVKKEIAIPEDVPKATYVVRMSANDQSDERITCVEAKVTF